jgi:valacyclovir hydrolase
MPFTDIATGARLFYDEAGPANGTPFVALHGLLGTGRAHLSRLIDWLAEAGYRVCAPTLRGYGQSQPKPRDFPPNFYQRDGDDVLAFMDALGIGKAHVFGYSDGGETALAAAGTQPDRFLSITTVGAVGFFDQALRPVVQNMYPGDWITPEERERNGIADVNAFVLGWMHAFKQMIDAGGDVTLRNAHRISAPLLILLGTEDKLNPETHGQRFAARAQRGRVVIFPTGHAIHDEDWDGFQRVVGAFLREVEQP